MNRVSIRNAQRSQRVNTRLLRQITLALLAQIPPGAGHQIDLLLLNATAMTDANRQHLGHEGSTDVITFPYSAPGARPIHGELLISIDDAIINAASFQTTWPEELARYVIHGVLHLSGFDDTNPRNRIVMKRKENLLLRQAAASFPLSELNPQSKLCA
jgi:probable rRNA maturation factor